jgi:2-iminobutanoate/2-iminopropanoate deaminase
VIEVFNPPTVWQPFGAFSMAAVEGDGRIVHLKGQVALDRDGRIVGKGDVRAQTRQVLENIRDVLAAMGGRMEDVLSLTHYVTDIQAFAGAGDIRREFFRELIPSPRRCRWPRSTIPISSSRSPPSPRYRASVSARQAKGHNRGEERL